MMSCSTSKMHYLDLQLQTTLMATTTFSHLTQASLCFFPPHKFVPSLLNSLLHYNRRSLQLSCSSLSSKDSVQNLRVVFAGGGTGSNVYPAVAIAEELKRSNPACEFLFFGSSNSIESTAVTSAGYNFAPVLSLCFSPVSSITLFQLCSSPCRFVKSLIQCSRHLRDFKPHIVVGTGGYVSFPVCLAAKINNIMVVIHEPNSAPGFVNSVLALFAHKIFVAFNSTVDSFPRNKCVVCGNPVRLSLRNPVSKAAARSHFFPGYGESSDSEKDKVLLVLGGSLGANAVNIAMLNLYHQMLRQNNGLYLIWQTGVETYDEMDSLVKNHPRLYLTPFMHCMDLAYAAADLIVSRAGAMTCYEILATGKPSILIPSPHLSEGNQFRNASLLADLAGVTVITEEDLDSCTLAIAIEGIFRDKKKMEEMSERALKAANPKASAEIAKHIFSLVRQSIKSGEIAKE